MTDPQARYGIDLRLLGDLERQNDRNGGSDLFSYTRPQTGLVDLQTLQDVQNLQQALLLRFLTRQGDLAQLGHPDYGSRLYTLIGELNNATNRNRAKLFVLEALAAEPRVQRVISVDVTAGARDRVDISVSLIAIQSDTPLNFVFPFFLGGRQ
ncbi:Phage baseplate assembly protein W [Rhizobiales bacterium GAS191]|nr:Phage baseplate assembly protein W [Rhizobiales bacterium GAS191]